MHSDPELTLTTQEREHMQPEPVTTTAAAPAEIAVNKPDVGEGWRRLLPEDVIQDGDEVDVGSGVGSGEEKWVPTACPGRRVVNFPTTRYRRRVTPVVPEAPQPAAGEGWRELGPDETLQAGDECDIGVNEPRWVVTQRAGRRVSENTDGDRYRRRVTPDAQPIEITCAAISAMCERNARDALLKKIELLKAENHEQQDRLLQTCLENERLRSEVERLREDLFRSQLTLKERKAVAFAEQHFVYFKNQARTLRGLLKRLGGGK